MKKILAVVFTFTMLFSGLSTFAQKYSEDAILGKWYNDEETGMVKIYKEDGKFFGKLVWLKDPIDPFTKKPKLDKKNPNEALRDRPVLNLVILSNFVYDDGEWEDGKIYDPKTGKTYSCYMELLSAEKLKIRGFIGLAAFGKTTYWNRATEVKNKDTESAH